MEYPITVTYTQINIFNDKQAEFNLWNDNHVAQGFAWREKAVSFAVPDHDGDCLLIPEIVREFPPLTQDTIRAIIVPFNCLPVVHIATLSDDVKVILGLGHYNIEFRLVDGENHKSGNEYDFLIYIYFKKPEDKDFTILRKSGEMTSDRVITTTARIRGNRYRIVRK